MGEEGTTKLSTSDVGFYFTVLLIHGQVGTGQLGSTICSSSDLYHLASDHLDAASFLTNHFFAAPKFSPVSNPLS